jgi:hypothetical protein
MFQIFSRLPRRPETWRGGGFNTRGSLLFVKPFHSVVKLKQSLQTSLLFFAFKVTVHTGSTVPQCKTRLACPAACKM